MPKSKANLFPFAWIVSSVLLFFIGIFLSASSEWSGFGNLGTYLWVIGLISIFFFTIYSTFLWFKLKKGDGIKNLITAYNLLAFLFTIGGLVGAFLTFPDGFTFFIAGLSMFALYWIVRLIVTIFKSEEDFQ